MFFLIIMAVCLIYCVIIISYAGLSSSFAWFWLAAGMVSGLIYVVVKLPGKGVFPRKLPLWLTVGFWTTAALGAVLAVFIESFVISGMFAKADPAELDYLIVLGAHVNGEEPSKSLRYRLNKAIEYLDRNEDLTVIVSGGKGRG